jgi:hypothetical protein
MYIHISIQREKERERENKILLVSLSEGTMGGRRWKDNVKNEKY